MTRPGARDFSERGREFLDYRGRRNTVEYSVFSPLGYRVYVSRQALHHSRKHSFARQWQERIPSILGAPDVIVPDYDDPGTHLYCKAIGDRLATVVVREAHGRRFVVTFFGDRRIKGLKSGRLTSADFLYLRGGFRWRRWK